MSYFKYQSKNIFYQVIGEGEPLLFLHGDTASSKMFEMILPLYQDCFQCILIDFLGNGQSDRVKEFPIQLWEDQALQTIALLEHLSYDRVHLLGTSGGAYVALHVVMKKPELIGKVIADSFDGRTLREGFADDLLAERNFSIKDADAKLFYEWCQGEDWLSVVEANTRSLVSLAQSQEPLFHDSFESIKNPLLLIGSLNDEMLGQNLKDKFDDILKDVMHGSSYLFKDGQHPTVLSRAEEVAQIVKEFI